MRHKSVWVVLIGLVAAVAYAGNVLATPSTVPGFSGAILAKTTLDRISSHVQTQDPQSWNEVIKTEGTSDLYVVENTWDPAACNHQCIPSTGWHTHPGPSFVVVTVGSLTVYDGDDPACTPHVYTAGTANNSFIDPGDGHVHIVRDESGALAKDIAVQLIPAGAVRRQDAPAPSTCPF